MILRRSATPAGKPRLAYDTSPVHASWGVAVQKIQPQATRHTRFQPLHLVTDLFSQRSLHRSPWQKLRYLTHDIPQPLCIKRSVFSAVAPLLTMAAERRGRFWRLSCSSTAFLIFAAALASMAASERRAKIRRLATSSTASQSVLCSIVQKIREMPEILEQPLSRRSVKRAVDEVWKKVGYKQQVVLATGGTFDWEIASLPRFLVHLTTVSSTFRNACRQMWEANPCTRENPWRLVVYGDELTPGNVLRLDNKRKFFAVYVTIRELGPVYLKHESMWLTVAVIRSSVAKTIPGGLSHCMRLLFRRWFLEDRLSEDGVILDLGIPGSRLVRAYLSLGNVVADGDAYRAMWSAKGASGKLICLLCKNVLSERTESEYLVHLSCPFYSKFDLASDAEIWEKADKLSHSRVTNNKGQHKRLQLLYGLTDSPQSVLWDMDLRDYVKPATAITYDPMHALLCNGIVQNETSVLLAALKSIGVRWESLLRFVKSDWHISHAVGNPKILEDCFAAPRKKSFQKDGIFKAGASEMLLVSPVICFFLRKVTGIAAKLPKQTASFEALCEVLNIVASMKQGAPNARQLAAAMEKHAIAFAEAYPSAEVKPKNHYALHVPAQSAQNEMLLDAFVGERKHCGMKRVAAEMANTRCFERSVITNAVCKQIEWLTDPAHLCDGLASPVKCPELGHNCSIASAMLWNGTRVVVGDCVFRHGHVFIINACADLALDGLALLVDRYEKVAQVTTFASRWTRASDDAEILQLAVGEFLQLVPVRYQEGPLTIVCLQL